MSYHPLSVISRHDIERSRATGSDGGEGGFGSLTDVFIEVNTFARFHRACDRNEVPEHVAFQASRQSG